MSLNDPWVWGVLLDLLMQHLSIVTIVLLLMVLVDWIEAQLE